MTLIGCWRFTGTRTQNGVGSNHTMLLKPDSLLGEFAKVSESWSQTGVTSIVRKASYDCVIRETSHNGGGIYCVIRETSHNGGGIYCVIRETSHNGGGIYCVIRETSHNGGGFYCVIRETSQNGGSI